MLLPALTLWSLAAASSPPAATLTERATTPAETASIIVGVGAGQRDAGPLSLEARADLRLYQRLSLTGGATWNDGQISPVLGARYQFLTDKDHGMDLTGSLSVRALGLEDAGAELEFRGIAAKTLGRWTGLLSAMVGKGLGERGDVDFEAGATAGLRVAGPFLVGVEARVRGELVDTFKTEEDEGRPIELVVGPTASLQFERLVISALAGYRSPRGTGSPGFAAFATAGVDF